jgi:hypothetical protein
MFLVMHELLVSGQDDESRNGQTYTITRASADSDLIIPSELVSSCLFCDLLEKLEPIRWTD